MSQGLIQAFLNLAYPRKCPACKQPRAEEFVHETVCSSCWEAIEKTTPPFCAFCGRHLEADRAAKRVCVECQRNRPHFDHAHSACVYNGVIRELIQEFKYKGKDYLSRPLSSLMTGFLEDYEITTRAFNLIIPMPLHKARLREREFNQAQLLSKTIARKFGLRIMENTLIRTRNTPMQAQLPDTERHKNIAGSFAVKNPETLRGRHILLVDDVLTTGATANEAARVLKEAGAGTVTLLTLAH